MDPIVIDYGVGTYPLDVRATFDQDGETYAEVLVFRDFTVTYQVDEDGVRAGTHQSLDSRNEYREYIKTLASMSQKLDECECENHHNVTSEMQFFVRGQDV